MNNSLRVSLLAGASALAAAVLSAPAQAEGWWDTVALSLKVEAGITFNPDDPARDLNFGHLFTDRANTPLLNQVLLTLERPLDAKATGHDFGFKLQPMFGSDARYTQFLGEFDEEIGGRSQFDIVEANLQFHMPWLTERGIDLKIGQYPTLLGAEVIDASANLLYSHSYIFNFGVPLKHTGFLTTTHLGGGIDLYAGIDTGVNTSLGEGDNNDALGFLGGLGLPLFDGAVTVLATTHIGAENVDEDSDLRYLTDAVVTWKISDRLTSITDLNYARDDGFDARGYGIAQYLSYAVNDSLTLIGRAEVWRDEDGFFVAAFPSNDDFLNFQKGDPNTAILGEKTTYGAVTLGLNYRPQIPGMLSGMVIRPELRYDASLGDTKPFDGGSKSTQFTFGIDVVIPLTF